MANFPTSHLPPLHVPWAGSGETLDDLPVRTLTKPVL